MGCIYDPQAMQSEIVVELLRRYETEAKDSENPRLPELPTLAPAGLAEPKDLDAGNRAAHGERSGQASLDSLEFLQQHWYVLGPTFSIVRPKSMAS